MTKQILSRLPKKEKLAKSGEKELAGTGPSLPSPMSDARTTTDLTMST
jgi:serine/threonine-protein phosphatase 2A regulatory subunit B'